MGLLQDEDLQFLKDNFGELAHDVTLRTVTKQRSLLIVPGQEEAPAEDASKEVKQIVEEVAATSPRLKVDHAAAEPGERIPQIVFSSPTAKGTLRYFGLPAGYEMSTLVAAIMDLGVAEPLLPPEIAERLGALKQAVHIQVFVTPT
jgi:alkyl hydroperoxide reductase subunit AhpF